MTPPPAPPILGHKAVEETYAIATLIKQISGWVLHLVGLEHNPTALAIIYVSLVLGISILAGMITRVVVLWIVCKIGKHYAGDLYETLSQMKFFAKLCRLVTPIVVLLVIPFTFNNMKHTGGVIMRITLIYTLCVFGIAICTFINALWHHVNTTRNTKKLPLQGISQIIKGTVWIVITILSVAIILDRSPGKLVAGVGAFAAVLMLVFKDPILGVVAGVQLSENDSLHVGDWIMVKGTDANGTVMDVSLTMVKILNFDKTITTVPPYSLVSQSFTNYRNMELSNTRRIDNSWMVDVNSIKQLSDDDVNNLCAESQEISAVVNKIKETPDKYPGAFDTNLGLMRYCLAHWLRSLPYISQSDIVMTRLMTPTSEGIPLNIYCFTNTSHWADYENMQSTIFEHMAVMLSRFGLYAYELVSSRSDLCSSTPNPGSILTSEQPTNVAKQATITKQK